MRYETEAWPFVEAKNYKKAAPGRHVRLIVIHAMQAPEGPNTAENVARWFANQGKGEGPSSAHICVDNTSIVQSVHDNDVAYAAPGANRDGVHVELAGFTTQTEAQWLDAYGLAMLARGADAVAQYCLKYDLPVRHLTDHQLADGLPGIVGHDQVSRVYKLSDHTDPGPHFPWDHFLEQVRVSKDGRELAARTAG